MSRCAELDTPTPEQLSSIRQKRSRLDAFEGKLRYEPDDQRKEESYGAV